MAVASKKSADKIQGNIKGRDLPDSELGKILSLYEKTAEKPEKIPKKQFILCAVGLVGSGKTTVMKPLSKKLKLIRITGDEIREILFNQGYNQKRLGELSYMFNKKYLGLGYSLAIDSDCAGERVKKDIKKLSKNYGAKIIFIHINPPERFIINKLTALESKKRRGLVENWPWILADSAKKNLIELYFFRKRLHSDLNIPFLCEVDTSAPNWRKQLKTAIDLIQKEAKTH